MLNRGLFLFGSLFFFLQFTAFARPVIFVRKDADMNATKIPAIMKDEKRISGIKASENIAISFIETTETSISGDQLVGMVFNNFRTVEDVEVPYENLPIVDKVKDFLGKKKIAIDSEGSRRKLVQRGSVESTVKVLREIKYLRISLKNAKSVLDLFNLDYKEIAPDSQKKGGFSSIWRKDIAKDIAWGLIEADLPADSHSIFSDDDLLAREEEEEEEEATEDEGQAAADEEEEGA